MKQHFRTKAKHMFIARNRSVRKIPFGYFCVIPILFVKCVCCFSSILSKNRHICCKFVQSPHHSEHNEIACFLRSIALTAISTFGPFHIKTSQCSFATETHSSKLCIRIELSLSGFVSTDLDKISSKCVFV